MCTAISIKCPHLAGRTLDLDLSFGEALVLTPRGYKGTGVALLGVAHIENGAPLYYDAVNEKGLFAAGLNFPCRTVYHPEKQGFINLASFEVIPNILTRCSSVKDAVALLKQVNVTPKAFSENLPPSPLHWMIADDRDTVVAESTNRGLCIYDNPYGVMTNSPEFSYHTLRLADFAALSSEPPQREIWGGLPLEIYSRGLGAAGLPGDWSSVSRFIRGAYTAANTAKGEKFSAVSQFFHIAQTVSCPLGCVKVDDGRTAFTQYTCCADTEDFVYYVTTYGCRRIYGYRPDAEEINSDRLVIKELPTDEDICYF